jgi:ABC-2 type transport system ATP-binding protein
VRTHKLLVGPRTDPAAVASIHNVIEASHTARQTTLLVRLNGAIFDPSWEVRNVSLEDIVLAYLGQSSAIDGLHEREPVVAYGRKDNAQ